MANDEHVAILKKGVAAWNAWRDENPDIRPDLSGANLNEANLNEADLRGADLSGANATRRCSSGRTSSGGAARCGAKSLDKARPSSAT
jgi:uncharacterized protein YjbI with pentapeptide repeats